MTTPTMQTMRWMQVPGNTLFAVSKLVMVLFILRLSSGRSFPAEPLPGPTSSGRGQAVPARAEICPRLMIPITEILARGRSRVDRCCGDSSFNQGRMHDERTALSRPLGGSVLGGDGGSRPRLDGRLAFRCLWLRAGKRSR